MYVDHPLDARIRVGQAKRVYGLEAMQVMETTPLWFMLDLALKVALRPPARHLFKSWPRTPRLSFQPLHSHLLIDLGGSPFTTMFSLLQFALALLFFPSTALADPIHVPLIRRSSGNRDINYYVSAATHMQAKYATTGKSSSLHGKRASSESIQIINLV